MSGQQLWVPGYAGPLDNLVERIHRRIEAFATEANIERAFVEVELADGVRFAIESLTPEPGYGFVTLRPYPGDDVPDELIVPIGSIKRIELSKAPDEEGSLGFALPSA